MFLDPTALIDSLQEAPFRELRDTLVQRIEAAVHPSKHGHLSKWMSALDQLPHGRPSTIDCRDSVTIGQPRDLEKEDRARLETSLRELIPWRKGPWELFGLTIETEWRSDWKWERIVPHLAPLEGRRVLDVGCGNGYYAMRLWGQGATRVIGIDPSLLFVAQFQAMKRYAPEAPVDVLPFSLEDFPETPSAFDTILSMGVLYHRRSPFEHLAALRERLGPGGQLVLETLVLEGALGDVFSPPGRYAKMRNVFFIPSPPTMVSWLERSGLRNVQCVDVTPTSCEEQRATEWMPYESLRDFLDPKNAARTIEGWPSPRRGVFIAEG